MPHHMRLDESLLDKEPIGVADIALGRNDRVEIQNLKNAARLCFGDLQFFLGGAEDGESDNVFGLQQQNAR